MTVGLLQFARRSGIRSVYYVAAYWMLNIFLVVAEARWHFIYRLTMWDIEQLKALALLSHHASH